MPALRLLLLSALLVASLASPAAAQVTTFGNADGTLRLPEALAVAPDGTVFVGDHFSGRIHALRDGRPAPEASFGLSGEVCGRFGAVGGIARAADGRMYVLDSDNQRVNVFDAAGRLVRCFGRDGVGIGQLRTSSGAYAASTASGGIAVAGAYVYVADAGNDRVQRFTLDGGSPKVIGRGRLRAPQGLAVRDGRLLVADDRNHRVAEFTTSGRFVRAARAGLKFPYDVAIDARGRAYVADNNGHRIVVLDRRLRRMRAWGSFGRGPGKLIYPRAVALAPGGNVLVADPGNDRVTEYTPTGSYVRTLGRNGRRAGAISTPFDVAVSPRGEVAVGDGNMRISWFGLDGRWLGAWAQGKSFQSSTAIVTSPRSLTFVGDDRLRVVEGGAIRDLGGGRVEEVTGGFNPFAASRRGRPGGPQFRAIAPAAGGEAWLLASTGELAKLDAERRVGPTVGDSDPRDRVATDVAVLTDGSLAVPEATPERRVPVAGIVRRYDPRGRRIGQWTLARPVGGEVSKPSGIVSDGAGGVWVEDAANGRVVRLGPDGAVRATVGTPGAGLGELAVPTGLAVDCEGALLVADSGNNRIVRFAGDALPGGPVSGAAGCAPRPSPPTAARKLPRPIGLKVRTRSRPPRPGGRMGVFRASCARTCTLTVQATGSAVTGRGSAPFTLRTRRSGRTITVTATAAQVTRMRRALARPRGLASVGLVVQATSRDGIRDVETATITFRR